MSWGYVKLQFSTKIVEISRPSPTPNQANFKQSDQLLCDPKRVSMSVTVMVYPSKVPVGTGESNARVITSYSLLTFRFKAQTLQKLEICLIWGRRGSRNFYDFGRKSTFRQRKFFNKDLNQKSGPEKLFEINSS